MVPESVPKVVPESVPNRLRARVPLPLPHNYKPSFLPTAASYADRPSTRPTLHQAHPDDWSRSLCGAPVIGILVWDEPLECVVCAELLEGRKG